MVIQWTSGGITRYLTIFILTFEFCFLNFDLILFKIG